MMKINDRLIVDLRPLYYELSQFHIEEWFMRDIIRFMLLAYPGGFVNMSAFEMVRNQAVLANTHPEELNRLSEVADLMVPIVQSFIQLSIGAHCTYFQYLKLIDPFSALFIYNPTSR